MNKDFDDLDDDVERRIELSLSRHKNKIDKLAQEIEQYFNIPASSILAQRIAVMLASDWENK